MDGSRKIPSGKLQVETLHALQKLGKASTRDVLMELRGKKQIAYTTVNTVLDRLYRRGLVKRSKAPGRGGKKYIYSPATRAYLRSNIVPQALNTLVSAFGPSVISAIHEGLEDISKEENEKSENRVRRQKAKV
jgi:BlaI family penicillinase repressor